MPDDVSFGHWLQRRRKALDLTQAQLGQGVGCSRALIRKIEADERRPSRELAARLAARLQLGVDEQPVFVRFARGESAAPCPAPFPTPPVSLPRPQSPSTRTTLPVPSTPLVGRAHAIAAIAPLVVRVRLLTLVGPPGIGKTRLSLAVAAAVGDAFPDGVHIVPLASIRDPALVIPTIAQLLGVTEAADQPLIDRLTRYLAENHLLLGLDNVEHVMGAAPGISTLLAAAPHLVVLATSREPLHLYGEHVYVVPPLAVPDLQHLPSLAALAEVASVRLFVQRAHAVCFDFVLTPENAASVANICVGLEGLPLALELAAAWVNMFPVHVLLQRLHHTLDLLTGGAHDLPLRHHTLRTAIAWSYDLLPPVEQTLFTHLAVFVGDWTLEAAEAVCAHAGGLTVLAGLRALLDKSLVQRHAGKGSDSRYGMLALIRAYAEEHLAACGEEAVVRASHARHYLALGDAVAAQLASRDAAAGMHRLTMDADNVRAALHWCLAHDPAAGLRLATTFAQWCEARGYASEGHRWLVELLAHARRAAG